MRRIIYSLFTLSFVLFSTTVLAQSRTVTGTVTDELGEPVIGATVRAEGIADVATITGVDGEFALDVPEGVENLIVSFVGMGTRTVPITGGNIAVSLAAESEFLDEVIVMGYYEAKREQLTGSAVQIGSGELEQLPVSSVDQALQGKVAGLTFSSESGTPGAVGNIRIRGISSINAGNEPLFVVDGVPISNYNYAGTGATSTFSGLSSLNTNDIESVTVLKDASAIAAYGARGTNGVIVITTKTGAKDGKTKFNFSSDYGISNDANDGPYVLTAAQQEELLGDAIFNTYGAQYGFSRGEALDFGRANLYNTNSEIYNWIDSGRPDINWSKAITNYDAPRYQANLSASGGGEKFDFYGTLGYNNQDATVIGGGYKRVNGGLRLGFDLSEAFRFETNNTVSNGIQDGLLEQSAYFASPRAAKFFTSPAIPIYNDDGTLNQNVFFNPVYIEKHNIKDNQLTRILTNNQLIWSTPIENLTFATRYAFDHAAADYKEYGNRIHGDDADVDGSAYRSWDKITGHTFQNSLDYFNTLGENHNYSIKLLQEYQKEDQHFLSAYAEGFAADNLTNLDNAGSPQSTNSSFYDSYNAAYMAMVNYDFKDKYILNTMYRREGNSRFDKETRWGDFWSVGAAWNIHEEGFLTTDVIDFLKLRASVGLTGNAGIGLNTYQSKLGLDADYDGGAAIYPSTFGSAGLGWEKAMNYEGGVDFGLFDRVEGALSYYQRRTFDMLLNDPLSRTTGFASQLVNIGKMRNSGIELELDVDAVKTDDFLFSIGGHLATNENEVTFMPLDPLGEKKTITGRFTKVEEGHTVYEWFIRKFAGVDPDTGVNTWYINGVDGETTTDYSAAKKAYQGESALPTLTAGINTNIEYKGFSLQANGAYAGGHKVYESWTRYTNGTDLWPIWFNGVSELMDRWQKPGDITRISKFEFRTKPWRDFDKYLYDGDYFRLKNVTLGYNFPTDFLGNVGINDVKIFIRGTNMWTVVKDDRMKYDPEVAINGFTSLTTPPVKTFLGGINLNF